MATASRMRQSRDNGITEIDPTMCGLIRLRHTLTNIQFHRIATNTDTTTIHRTATPRPGVSLHTHDGAVSANGDSLAG
jgi:hypothetical protein